MQNSETKASIARDEMVAAKLKVIQDFDRSYPHPNKTFSYGTAGFRDKADLLERAFFRVGLVVAIRAKQVGTCGVMITASHNPWEDNGVKIIEPDGSMLVSRWEQMAEHIVNAEDLAQCLKSVSESTVKQWTLGVDIFSNEPIKIVPQAETLEKYLSKMNPNEPKFACVYVGRDTRLSSPGLAQAVINGIKSLDVNYQDFGEVTTPQLHFLVANHSLNPKAFDYIENFAKAFLNFCEITGEAKEGYESQFALDCANGVGFFAIDGVLNFVSQFIQPTLLNTKVESKKLVNYECGAEYVHKDVHYPNEYDITTSPTKGCSFDGDADRLIYFRRGTNKNERVEVIDGDK